MPVLAMEKSYGPNDNLKGKTLLADTSFVFAYHDTDRAFHAEAKQFKDTNSHAKFVINVTVKQELLHEIRKRRLESEFKTNRDVLRGREKGIRDIAKILIKKGRKTMVQSKLRGHIQQQLKQYEKGFAYVSGASRERNLDWGDMLRLMEEECLDSSDAMILNFASDKALYGVVSCDRDFNPYYNPADLNIFMPTRLIDWQNSEIELSSGR